MKKIYFLLFCLVGGSSAFAQAFTNAGMETWRSSTSGTSPTINVHSPTQWYGFDSLIIADGETFGSFIGAGSNWHAQLFQESTIVHGGSSSAKMMTLKQDTLGYFAGILSNSQVAVNVTTLLGGGTIAQATTFSGGTPVTGRIASVSAWVQYKAGKDSTGATGADSGQLVVTVYSQVHGIDSAVGNATLKIPPTSGSWVQVTAQVSYNDTLDGADTVRVQFASGGNGTLDSSTLYVDDVTMAYIVPNGVKNVNLLNEVKVYPNPASGILYFDVAQNAGLSCSLYSINGQVVAIHTLSGKDAVDISNLPEGMYFYNILDDSGNIVQRGKVSVVK